MTTKAGYISQIKASSLVKDFSTLLSNAGTLTAKITEPGTVTREAIVIRSSIVQKFVNSYQE